MLDKLKVEKLFKEVTKYWEDKDWDDTTPNDLRYHIGEFLAQGGEIDNMIVAVVEFEKFMGW